MARWKKPTKEEILESRRSLAERARRAALRLPGAVAEIRKSIGMTQEEFAKMLGLTRRQVAEIEAGTANPTLETLDKIGRLFGFTVGFVPRITGEDAAKSPSQLTSPNPRVAKIGGKPS